MKLLYCVLVLCLIQYGLTAVSAKPFRQRQQVLEFYKQEMNKLTKEHCAGFKLLFEKLLQDDRIKQGSTPPFQNFKENANEFLRKYPSAAHKELEQLILDISQIRASSKDPEDSEYIARSMLKNGFSDMYTNYMKNYKTVVTEIFIPKFEEYKRQLIRKELGQQQDLMDWYKNLKACSNYYCYSKYFNEFPSKKKP